MLLSAKKLFALAIFCWCIQCSLSAKEGYILPPYMDCPSSEAPEMKIVTRYATDNCGNGNSVRHCDVNRYVVSNASAPRGPSYVDFVNHMRNTRQKLLFVGDSLSLQSHAAFHCSYAAEAGHELEGDPVVAYASSNFLHHPPNGYVFTNESVVQTWGQEAIRGNFTHLLLNAGAHYNHYHFSTNQGGVLSDDGMVELYRKTFSLSGPLMQKLRHLQREYNMTIIWRDTAPAGVCPEYGWSAYKLYPLYNAIAGFAISSIGGHILSIWHDTSSQWQSHISSQDPTHWCLNRADSVPSTWNDKVLRMPIF